MIDAACKIVELEAEVKELEEKNRQLTHDKIVLVELIKEYRDLSNKQDEAFGAIINKH